MLSHPRPDVATIVLLLSLTSFSRFFAASEEWPAHDEASNEQDWRSEVSYSYYPQLQPELSGLQVHKH